MDNGKWWQEDFTEELTLLFMLVLAVSALFILGDQASEIVSAIGGGFTGYLVRASNTVG